MAQLPQTPKTPEITIRDRKSDSPGLWLVLVIGSAVIHSALAIAAVPWLSRLSSPEAEIVSSVPIDLVTLSPETPGSSQLERDPALTSIAASPDQNSVSDQNSDSPSPAAPGKSVSQFPAASSTPKVIRSAAPPVTPAPSSSTPSITPSLPPEPAQDVNSSPQPNSVESPTDDAGTVDSDGAGQFGETTEAASASATGSSPQAPAITETPGFATIPIDRPPPDVSETLPISPDEIPSPMAQVEVNRENTPVNLIVRLDFDRLPVEQAGDDPDRLAAPEEDITSQEISTVDESACAGVLKPEVMESLGVRVALQVGTDATGKVIQVARQVTSRNSAYDELARCLVQHWGFVPAEEEGQPVPSNALLVWVTIERR